ncbi:MAG: nucleotidyl transferase AbiEii/AbiGii toxin family protein [bacterium]|nr:nucleotidyl transferase AbiEii/AbiGii toxin family protein [bacterium]
MFDTEEIKRKAIEFKLTPADVERDYIQSWIIKEVSSDPRLSPQLTLKGSGALRKLYYPDTRFARDLDFSAYSHVEKEFLKERLNNIGHSIEKQTGIPFVDEVRVEDKNLPEKMQVDALEARMYFKAIHSDGKFNLKTQVDVTRGENLSLPPQYRSIIHPYSDHELFSDTKVRSQKLEEIIATKFITLLHRRKAGDFFDLVYSIFLSPNEEINRSQIIRVLLSKTDFSRSFEHMRDYFCNFPAYETYAQSWGGLIVPLQSSMTFETAHNSFAESVPTFFDEIAAYVTRMGGRMIRPSTFSNIFREMIISGGRNKKLIKLTYTGMERDVEPYKLEFYTPQNDGITKEYFWGYDRSGGTSNTQSIKQFICDKIENVQKTQKEYSTQWEVEL